MTKEATHIYVGSIEAVSAAMPVLFNAPCRAPRKRHSQAIMRSSKFKGVTAHIVQNGNDIALVLDIKYGKKLHSDYFAYSDMAERLEGRSFTVDLPTADDSSLKVCGYLTKYGVNVIAADLPPQQAKYIRMSLVVGSESQSSSVMTKLVTLPYKSHKLEQLIKIKMCSSTRPDAKSTKADRASFLHNWEVQHFAEHSLELTLAQRAIGIQLNNDTVARIAADIRAIYVRNGKNSYVLKPVSHKLTNTMGDKATRSRTLTLTCINKQFGTRI